MVSARQLSANRANALKSTGPRTAAGKARAAANALASGLYAKLVVLPGLGETPDGLLAFRTATAKALGARGPVERALAYRVAELLWRQQRVMVAETAIVTRATGALPPDPANVAPSGIHFVRELPANAPTHTQLSRARSWAGAYRTYVAELEAAITALAPPAPADRVIGEATSKSVLAAAANELNWSWAKRNDGLATWNPILADLNAPTDREEFTLGLVRAAVHAAAAQANREPESVWTNTVARLPDMVADYRRTLSKWETEEAKYVAVMESERQQVTAAGLVADAKQQDAIARQEAHLGRELTRALAVFEQVRILRPQGIGPLGFVLQRHAAMTGGGGGIPELTAAG